MPRTKSAPVVERAKGLYLRGNVWWIALARSPIDSTLAKPLSTGCAESELEMANSVIGMTKKWTDDGSEKQREWLDRALREPKAVKLLDLYNASKRGELELFADRLKSAAAEANAVDLDPLVTEWIEKDLGTREDCRQRTKDEYARYVRYFIPAGKPFPPERLNEQYVRDTLKALKGARHDETVKVQGGTQRNYLVGLTQFVQYAMRVEALAADPLKGAFGKRGWAAKRRARSVYYEYPRVRVLLKELEYDREAHAAVALIFGSGLELGGLLDQKKMHIGNTLPDGRGTVVVPGRDSSLSGDDRKNVEFRSERTIFVDKWAWKIVTAYVESLRHALPRAPLWSWKSTTKGRVLREKFYRAQVAAGFIEQPEFTDKDNPKWNSVQPHTLHDARHSYCINRSLGLDGETPRSAGFCASQLGHGSEQMVISVYKKAGVEERARTLQMAAALEEAKQMAVGAR